jgi:hypothetical protein
MTARVAEILREIESLSADEQRELAERLARQGTSPSSAEAPKWADIRGSAEYPMMGEDAQAWVTRTRREADERRSQSLRREP